MTDTELYTDGFDELERLLKEYEDSTSIESVTGVLEKGAAALTKDVRALPKPWSEIHKAGYTHLLNTVAHRRKKNEIEVGWGKYYGPMVENGTRRNKGGTPHIRPTYIKNKKKYGTIMKEALFGKGE